MREVDAGLPQHLDTLHNEERIIIVEHLVVPHPEGERFIIDEHLVVPQPEGERFIIDEHLLTHHPEGERFIIDEHLLTHHPEGGCFIIDENFFIPHPEELERRISLAVKTGNWAGLEKLQGLLHFPEEVALQMADTEYQLFYKVPPNDYLVQANVDYKESTDPLFLIRIPSNRSAVDKLIMRFNEVSAWVSHLIISQPTNTARRAYLSCILRVALSCWNIGNFNGAMEIVAGVKSIKMKPIWQTITENEPVAMFNFLSATLLTVEYDVALKRAMDMAECRVVPFFGAFVRELHEIVKTKSLLDSATSSPTPQTALQRKARLQREQALKHRQTAVMDHLSLFHQHYHTRNLLAPTLNLIDYLRTTTKFDGNRVVNKIPPDKVEQDSEYDMELDMYHPVQPLVHDHGVNFVSLVSSHTEIDQHVIQILHHGSTVILWESVDGQSTSASKVVLMYMRLDRSCSTLTWVRPSWSSLGMGATSDTDAGVPDYNLTYNPEETLPPGLLTKIALQAAGDTSVGNTVDDGFLDLRIVKEVFLGIRDTEKEQEYLEIAKRFGLENSPSSDCCITLLYGYGLSDNRYLQIICPPIICRTWFTGLCWIVQALTQQDRLMDKRVQWLREQYVLLYYEEGYCCGPLAAAAVQVFGGRDWSLSSMTKTGVHPGEASGALRREISMKIKKKQLLSSQTFKDRSLRNPFLEPSTMCMESSYWRSPTHRQSTPTALLEHNPDVTRHHSLGHLAYRQPIFEREGHSSTDYLFHGRHPRVGSILYENQMTYFEFISLFRSFSILMRKDLRDLFEQLAITYKNVARNPEAPTKNGAQTNGNQDKCPNKIGLLTRNNEDELDAKVSNSKKKMFDAIAAASIFTNCAGIDSNNNQVITLSTFIKFLETRQMELWTEENVIALIHRHEPDAFLRSQNCLSFEGFARYLMDRDNYACFTELEIPNVADMSRPLSQYYIASSHNTYLTGHQLKGESSVELYSQILLAGCRCVELDCWDGDDGNPMIYHGHTFTTKIPFNAVVETIDRNAFVTSPYPIILSIENHCSLQQQTRMAQTFQRVFGEKLVTHFLFDSDFCDEPVLPSPYQLRNRVLIKNKKLIMDIPVTLTTHVRPHGVRHSLPGRTSTMLSHTSSSSFNDDFSDDEYEDDADSAYEKHVHGAGAESQRHSSVGMSSHAVMKSSSSKRIVSDDKLKRKGSQIAKELSDMVIYIQAVKFRGLNAISPNSSAKHKFRIGMNIAGRSTAAVTGSASNINCAGTSAPGESDMYDSEMKRPNSTLPCYQCSSINENTAKKLCRKQPLALVAHTQHQLMRTYPAGMRIDSSNFNPVLFWAFGIQMTALNYQTEDTPMQINTAMFEMNGKCGYVRKSVVLWDKSHLMYKRFNPWNKEFDGLHSSQYIINVISGQYVNPSNLEISPCVEVEIIGLPEDSNKQRTKVIEKNALNPIWNDTFEFPVRFLDLAFMKFTIIDANTNHVHSQRVLPLKYLRSGYRHLRLRTTQNRPLHMSTLFIYTRSEEESLDNSDAADTMEKPEPGCSTSKDTPCETGKENPYLNLSGKPICLKRRMFFLLLHDVMPDELFTIIKIKQEYTTKNVILLALQKAGLPANQVKDHILIEEVAYDKQQHLIANQRILDLQEFPIVSQDKWKGEGRFILKRLGDDPSSRAWLASILSVSHRQREAQEIESAINNSVWDEYNTFLVCVYNVSPDIPYAILKVPLNAYAKDVVSQALIKARRLEQPTKFVLIEELEFSDANHSQQRALADDENVYSTQSSWQTIGRFILQERSNATPTSLRKSYKVTSNLRLATLERISRGLNVARNVASSSIKMPMQVQLSDPNISKSKKGDDGETSKIKRFIRGKGHSDKDIQVQPAEKVQRDVHSEGETLSDEESKDNDLMAAVSRIKKVSMRKFKEWKS